MAIAKAEILLYPSNANGRIDDSSAIADLSLHQIFDRVLPADRTAGDDDKVKLNWRFEDPDDADAQSTLVFLGAPTTDDAELYLTEANFTDTPGAPGFSDLYGIGSLDANVIATAASIDVLVKDGAVTQFRDGDTIVLLDHTQSTDDAQFIETAVISGAPSVSGDVVTLTLSAGLANAHDAADTYVACAVDYGTVSAGVNGSATVTSTSGTFDDAQTSVPDSGSIHQIWTLTFTSATNYDLTGDDLAGTVASGNISSIFAPSNPNTSTPYFSIAIAAWGGTYASGDTVVFTTDPCATPFMARRLIPAGAASSGNQYADVRVYLQA